MSVNFKFILSVLLIGSHSACRVEDQQVENRGSNELSGNAFEIIRSEHYDLFKVSQDPKALLILFPGMGGSPNTIQREFSILEIAKKNGVSVLMMDHTGSLFLNDATKAMLTTRIEEVIDGNNIPVSNVAIGGFSSGGIVSVLLSDHLIRNGNKIRPKKVFLVDSPLDLVFLYNASTNIDSSSHDISKQESEFIVEYFQDRLNAKENLLERIAAVSPYVHATKDLENMSALQQVELRAYTEPDSMWWWQNRNASYKEMNAYSIKCLVKEAKIKGWQNISLIETKNKGFRSNGDRHPHSWSIVDPEDLVDWILEVR